jgi:SAM-dependent methyltransferase
MPPSREAPRRARSPPAARSRRHLRTNLRLWEAQSRRYDRLHRRSLERAGGAAWGLWRRRESQLQLLGSVRGRRTLEVGCGAGRWSIALARRGARAVGLDLSPAQLSKARELARARRVQVDWVRANAERLPFPPGSFDRVFTDWGALTFADPRRIVPEASRVLRPGGRLVFANASPFRSIAENRRDGRMRRSLLYSYFELDRIEYPKPPEVNFQLPYGEWIRLFTGSGLRVHTLLETRPRPRERSTYVNPADVAWARQWPLETIWRADKPA